MVTNDYRLRHRIAPEAHLPQPRSTETSGSGGREADRQSRACLSRRRVCAAALGLSTADGRPKGLRQLSLRRGAVLRACPALGKPGPKQLIERHTPSLNL